MTEPLLNFIGSAQVVDELAPEALIGCAVIAMRDVVDREAAQIDLVIAEQGAERVIDLEKRAVRRDQGDADRRPLEGAPKLLLTRAERRLRSSAEGDGA